jgi:hypothetical protein
VYKLNNGKQKTAETNVGGNIEWKSNTDDGEFNMYRFPGTEFTTEQCRDAVITITEQQRDSAWDGGVVIYGDLEDGKSNFVISDSGAYLQMGKGRNGGTSISYKGNGYKF